jgi:hypothetical protein
LAMNRYIGVDSYRKEEKSSSNNKTLNARLLARVLM